MFPLLPEAQPSSQLLLRFRNILQCFAGLHLEGKKERKVGKEIRVDTINSLTVVCLAYGLVLFFSDFKKEGK